MDFPHFSRVNFKKIQGLIQDPDDFHCHFCFLDCMGTIAMRIYLFSNQWTLPPPSNPAQPPPFLFQTLLTFLLIPNHSLALHSEEIFARYDKESNFSHMENDFYFHNFEKIF